MVHVKAGSSCDEIALHADNTWLIRIRERPVKGAANEYLIRYLSKEWRIAKINISLEKGAVSPFKKISLAIAEESFLAIRNRFTK